MPRLLRPSGSTNRRGRRYSLEPLEGRTLLAGDVVISEFLAENGGGPGALLDENGDTSDWIELHNVSAGPVDLAGWRLTDDPANPDMWTLPSRTLAPGQRLMVFASGKDRTAAQLHTNFELNSAGEYLALVKPDGTIASEYAPTFPAQLENVSFGPLDRIETTTQLVGPETIVRLLAPEDGSLGMAWTAADYDDSTWPGQGTGGQGPQPVGFDTEYTPIARPFITSVVRGGTTTNPAPVLVQNAFAEDVLAYNDRTHQYNGQTAAASIESLGLTGADFIRVSNTDRNVANYSLAVTVNGTVDLYLLIDDRVGDNSNGNPPTLGTAMPWVAQMGFVDTGLNVGVDEGGEGVGPGAGIENFMSLYKKSGVTGTITLGAQNDGTARNNYGVAAIRPQTGSPIFSDAIETDVQTQMHGQNASVYLRAPFGYSGGGELDRLLLRVKYDDGFIAYLNGMEIARRNAPGDAGTPAPFDASATASRPDTAAVVYEDIDITSYGHLLLSGGSNVLAVQALNESAADADFLLEVGLSATASTTVSETQYFVSPTPGAANTPGVFGFVADTNFEGIASEPGAFHEAGFYTAPFHVALSTATPGAEIRYTTNGSPPTATTGTVYTEPVLISGTTTLRVAAFKPGYQPTNVDTQTYIFPAQVLTQSGAGLPPFAPWGHAGADWQVDPDIVNSPNPADRFTASDLAAVPSISLALDWNDMFGPGGQGIYIQGSGQERPASIELIRHDGIEGFRINGSVEIQGGTSDDRWKDDKLSMQLKFKRPYGPTKLDYDLFGEGATDSFDTIILDGVLNWSWVHSTDDAQREGAKYIQDQFMADLQNAMGGFAPHARYMHLFINGLYWGMYYVHERPDSTFQSDYQGGDKDEWNVIKHTAGTIVDNALTNPPGVSASTDYNSMLALANANLAVDANYDAVAERLDLPGFVDYLLLNWYGGNQDWAHKNWYASRRATPDGKWRFHSWDAEHVLRGEGGVAAVDINYIGDSPSGLHNRLLLNPRYRQLFGDRAQRHLFGDGVLTPAKAAATYQARMAEVDAAIRGESARWGDNSETVAKTRSDWLADQNELLANYFPQRTGKFIAHLRAAGLLPTIDAPVLSASGGEVPANFALAMSDPNNPAGTIYYTVDGSEPGAPVSFTNTTLLPEGAPLRALVPSAANGGNALGTSWTAVGFSDASWAAGAGGVGYDRNTAGVNYLPLIDPALNVESQMFGLNGSVYVRAAFGVADPEVFDALTLRMKYDDGFVAYLNGFEVARRFAPATVSWTSVSSGSNTDANATTAQDIDLSAHLHRLQDGLNVLAIHGLNDGTGSSDLLMRPELIGSRASSGGAGPTALPYTGPITLAQSGTVKARVRRGSTWSALAEALYTVDVPVRVSEIYYNPPGSAELTEFVELHNIGGQTLDLTGVKFTGGIAYEFLPTDANVTLPPNGRMVIVHDRDAFAAAYPGVPAGAIADRTFTGNLDNGGEPIELTDAGGGVIQSFRYEDAWHVATDGDGFTLVRSDTTGAKADWNLAGAWRASFDLGGSPGADDALAGDVDGNGAVDLADLAIMQAHLGMASGATRGDGDLNADGAVTRADVAGLAANFGRFIAATESPAAVMGRIRLDDGSGNFEAMYVEGDARRRLEARRKLAIAARNADAAIAELEQLLARDLVARRLRRARA